MRCARRTRRSGFALLPVVLTLALLAATAYLMTRESAMGVSGVASTQQLDRARYVAEAGLAHAVWKANSSDCSGYSLPATDFTSGFGTASYSATFTPTGSSPIRIDAKGSLAGGASHALHREPVRIYESSLQTRILQPDAADGEDTFLYEWKADWNYGASGNLDAGDNGFDSKWHALLRFELSEISATARVVSATLDLYQTNPSMNGGPLGVRRVIKDWDEGSNSGSSGSGATWINKKVDSVWTTPGGDLDPTPFGSTNVPSATGWSHWDVTTLVAGWIAGDYKNNGLALVHEQAMAQGRFASSDHSDATLHPKLSIVYACECGGGGSQTLPLQPGPEGLDSYLDDGNPTTPWSSEAEIRISNKINSQKRGLLRFNLSGINPAATVTSAELEMNLEGIGSGAAATIYTHRVLQSWVEGQATWNDASSGTPWATPGGDYDPTAVASADIDPLILGPTTWDVTALAADWVADPTANAGLMLLGSASVNHADFTTSDSTNAALRPRLTVHYACACGVDCSAAPVGFYRDEFNSHVCDTAIDYSGSDGTLDWSSFSWEDIGEASDSCASGVRLRDDGAGPFIRISSPGKGLKRQVDLSMFATARLSFDYRRSGNWADASDQLSIRVSDDGGSSWTEVGLISGPGTDAEFQTVSFDISDYRSDSTVVQFLEVNTDDGTDLFSLDNVQIDDGSVAGGQTVLLVVGETAPLGSKDEGRRALMVSWGFTVNLLDDSESQASFDAEAAAADVVYVSGSVVGGTLLDKLTGTTTPVVNELAGKLDNFGFSSGTNAAVTGDTFSKSDAVHYITSPFGGDPIGVFTQSLLMPVPSGTLAPDLQDVAEASGTPALVTLDTGAQRWDGNPAPARRVHLPFAFAETTQLTADGETIIQRAIQWAAGAGGGPPTAGVVFEEFTEAKANAATSLSIDKPAGTAAGDLLIASLVTDGSTSGSMSPPAGWNVVDLAEQGAAVTFGVWWKLAGASEAASYSFSWSDGGKVYGTVMRFSGHDPVSPIHASSTDGGSSSAPSSPAVTTTVPDTMILRLGGFDDDDITVDAPGLAGHTAITMDKSSMGNGTSSSGAGYLTQAAAGDSGTSTFSLTQTEEARTVTLAIAPDPN